MRDLYQTLREKEIDLERVRHEVEALRFVAPLLTEQSVAPLPAEPEETCQPGTELPAVEISQTASVSRNRWPLNVS
jgi:hypothetical protein